MSAFDPHGFLARNERRLLPIERLRELIDELVEDDALAYRLAGIDPSKPAPPSISDDELHVWTGVLDQAWAYELDAAPRPRELFWNAANMTLGVIGIGVALGPFGPVVVAVGAVIGIAGGTVSVISGIPLIRKDIASTERLRAIERAVRIVNEAAAGRTEWQQ
jgi:hypothetical protein